MSDAPAFDRAVRAYILATERYGGLVTDVVRRGLTAARPLLAAELADKLRVAEREHEKTLARLRDELEDARAALRQAKGCGDCPPGCDGCSGDRADCDCYDHPAAEVA